MTVIKILNSPKATIIPCIHEESGCSGLFNTITNEFYPVKTTEFEYIQSAETQYIDTGMQPIGGRMKRLTKRDKDGIAYLPDCNAPDFITERKAINRLAEYEDAEEQGLLVRLPCKVGDTVYVTFTNGIKPYVVDRIYIIGNGEVMVRMRFMVNETLRLSGNNFGKTVFTSREAAEKALEDA